MRYGQIRKYDVSNAKGISTTLFVTGCRFNCFGCFNKEYQDFSYGEMWTIKEEDLVLEYLNDNNVDAFSLLGGEVFHQESLAPLIKLLTRIKKEHPNKPIWIWSGFIYEDIVIDKHMLELLSLCDTLIDGQFKQELKDLTLAHRGSSNQRIIDVQQSLKQGEVVLYNI